MNSKSQLETLDKIPCPKCHGTGYSTKKTTFIRWADLPPGATLIGEWRGSRPVTKDDGSTYSLGEIVTPEGRNLVFTMPQGLRPLEAINIRGMCRILFKGRATSKRAFGYLRFVVSERMTDGSWSEVPR
jgi:hypothetical protein